MSQFEELYNECMLELEEGFMDRVPKGVKKTIAGGLAGAAMLGATPNANARPVDNKPQQGIEQSGTDYSKYAVDFHKHATRQGIAKAMKRLQAQRAAIGKISSREDLKAVKEILSKMEELKGIEQELERGNDTKAIPESFKQYCNSI